MTYDYRQTPRATKGFHIHLGKEHTYLFEWANFETAPQRPASEAPRFRTWAGFLTAMGDDTLIEQMGIDSIFMTYIGELVLDHYRDSYKWGAVRSLCSPETIPLLEELLRRGLVAPRTPVYWGNWANVSGIPVGSVEDLLKTNKVVVYHGSSSQRWRRIQRTGTLVPVKPKERVWPRDRKFKTTAVFVTTCPHRARYFAEHTAAHDRRKASPKEKGQLKPIVLEMTLLPSDVLVNDHDFLEYSLVEHKDPENSLKLFGQVGIEGSIPINRIRVCQPREVSL